MPCKNEFKNFQSSSDQLRFDNVATKKVTLPVLLFFLEIQHPQDHPEKNNNNKYI